MWFGIKARIDLIIKTIEGLFHRDTWQELEECDVLLVRHDNDCGYTYHGKAYSQLIDSIGELFEQKGLFVQSIATPHSQMLSEDAFFNPASYRHSHCVIALLGYVRKILLGIYKGEKWLTNRRVKLWINILALSKPECVIGIQPDEFLCRACKQANILVYDLQHGVISDDHPWYGTKYRVNTPLETLPTGFLCWDDQSIAAISKWAVPKGIQVVKIGSPWFLRFMKINPDDELVQDAIITSRMRDNSKFTIFVSLQWGMIKRFEVAPNGVMVDALEKVILDTLDIYDWVLRLHPIQLRTKQKDLITSYLISTFGAENGKKWIDDSSLPLPLVLKGTDLHITYHSTIIIETAWMGIHSGILNQQLNIGEALESYYAHERSLGIAEVLPHDPDIIKQWIEDTLAKGRAEPTMDTTGEELDAFVNEIVERCKNRNH